MVVNANNHPLHFRIVVTHPIGLAGVWIVGFIASEEIESLTFLAQRLYLREDIVASLDADGIGIAADKGRVLERRLGVQSVIHIFQFGSITQITVVGLSANNPVVGIIGEVNRSDSHFSFIGCTSAVGIVRIGVADAVTIVAAQSDAQAWNRIIVDAQCCTIFICDIELHRRLMSLVNPTHIRKLVGIQACQKLGFITEILVTAPERHTRLMPCRGHDGILAFRTVDGEITQWFVVGIVQAYGHHNMTDADVGPRCE